MRTLLTRVFCFFVCVFVLCLVYPMFLWIVNSWLPLRFSLTFVVIDHLHISDFYSKITSVDTEMWSKRQVWMSIFHIINLKKNQFMDTGVLDSFNKKLILDYYFCLRSGPVFLFQIFIITPLPLPRDIKLYH